MGPSSLSQLQLEGYATPSYVMLSPNSAGRRIVLSPPVVPRPWFSCRVTAIWCSTAQLPLRVEGSKTAPC